MVSYMVSAHVVRWLVVDDGFDESIFEIVVWILRWLARYCYLSPCFARFLSLLFLRVSSARVLAWSSLPLSWTVAATPTHPESVLPYARNLKDLAASTVWPRHLRSFHVPNFVIISLFQEGEQRGSGQHVLSNLHFRGMEGQERSNLFCHRTTRGGRKHIGKRRKLELSKGVVNILQCNVTSWSEHAKHYILTSDFDATLISRPTIGRKGYRHQSRRHRNLDGLARAAQQQTLLTTVRVQACSQRSEHVGFPSSCQSAVTMLVLSFQTHDWQGGSYASWAGRFCCSQRISSTRSVSAAIPMPIKCRTCVFSRVMGGFPSFWVRISTFRQVCGKICLSMEAASGPSNWVHRWSFREAPRTRTVRVEAKNPTSSIISWCLHAFGP